MDRIHSGVPGLDDLIEGGFKKGRFHMVSGEAGTCKSTFAMHYALQGIKDKGKSVYVSLEEPPEQMHDNISRFGLDVKKAIDKGKLFYIYTKPLEVKDMVESSANQIADEISGFKPDRVVFDSITTFNMEFSGESSLRGGMNQLMEIISKWSPGKDVTFLFTAESLDRHARFGIEYIMDSVVKLYNIKQGESRIRALEIFKMRGTAHSKNIHSLTLDAEDGMRIHEQTVLLDDKHF